MQRHSWALDLLPHVRNSVARLVRRETIHAPSRGEPAPAAFLARDRQRAGVATAERVHVFGASSRRARMGVS